MQRSSRSKLSASAGPPASRTVVKKSQQKKHTRLYHGGLSYKWIAVSMALGVAVWALKHTGSEVLSSMRKGPSVSSDPGASVHHGQALLRIHETFGCRSESEDFASLMADLQAAGAEVSNVALGYSNGRRGLMVSSDSV